MKMYMASMFDAPQVLGFGDVPADIMFVGDNPPRNIVTSGTDAYTETVRKMWGKITTSDVGLGYYFTFLMKWALPNGKKVESVKLARAAWSGLMEEIMAVHPKRIVVFGHHATRFLCPYFKSLREDHGAIFYNPDLQVEVIPTFDPLIAAYDPERREYFYRDLYRVFTLPRPVPPEVRVQEDKDFSWIAPASVLVLDLETNMDLNPRTAQITLLGLYNPGGVVTVLKDPTEDTIRALYAAIEEKGSTLLGHNIKFDLSCLSYASRLPWVDFPVLDTMLQARVHGQRVLSLKHLTTVWTDRPGSHAYGGTDSLEYLAEDLLSTWEVFQALGRKVAPGNPAFDLLNNATRAFTFTELSGAKIDARVLAELDAELKAQEREALDALGEATINWNSTEQVAAWLKGKGVRLTKKTDTGRLSVSAEVLEELAPKYPIVQSLLQYREAEKLHAYIKEYIGLLSQDTEYIHPSFKLATPRTGRTSCESPNLQNIPAYIKRLFVSRYDGGSIGVVDLDQAELRVAAILSGDETFAASFEKQDPHRYNASILYGVTEEEVTPEQRRRSKIATFGLVYGGTPEGLADRNDFDPGAMQDLFALLESRYPRLMNFLDTMGRYAVAYLKITSPFGRTRDLLAEKENKGIGSVRRMGINTPIQVTASDVALLLYVWSFFKMRTKKLRSRLIGAVHDSLIFDVYPGEEVAVATCVREAFKMVWTTPLAKFPLLEKVPFTGVLGFGPSWYDAEKTPVLTFPCTSRREEPAKELMI